MADNIANGNIWPPAWPLGKGNLVKLDQQAFYAVDEEARAAVKAQLGLSSASWIEDTLEGAVWVKGGVDKYRSRAFLEFNYDYGMEVEILTYLDGPNFIEIMPQFWDDKKSFFSHQGIHVDEMPDGFFGAELVQEMWTEKHTNRYLIDRKRTYHYRIYDTRPTLGVFTKLIKRIEKVD